MSGSYSSTPTGRTESDFDFASAIVIAHHKRRKDASPDIKAARARDQNREIGCFWTGERRGPIPRFIS